MNQIQLNEIGAGRLARGLIRTLCVHEKQRRLSAILSGAIARLV